MAFEGIPTDDDLACIRKLSRVEFRNQEQFKNDGLREERINLLYDIVVEKSHPHISYPMIWDLWCYALKSVCPDEFRKMNLKPHLYANGLHGEWVYDPAKNGKNIIKHGISFGEVASYAPRFSSLGFPSESQDGEKRWIGFSDLNLKKSHKFMPANKLELPLDTFADQTDLYTMSVTTLRSEDGGPLNLNTAAVPNPISGETDEIEVAFINSAKLRFISSIVLTRKSCLKQISSEAKHFFPTDVSARKSFEEDCKAYLEQYLFSDFQ